MGLLMSDTVLTDPMADDLNWLAERLREWTYASETGFETFESESNTRSE